MNEPLPDNPNPYVPPPSEAPAKTIPVLKVRDIVGWLQHAVADLIAHPGIAGFYGGCFWIMALLLGAIFQSRPEYTMSIASGCLLVGPFLAMGLYEVSRRREQGLVASLGSSMTCWESHLGNMGMLVLVLIVLELLWGRASLVVFAVFFNTSMPSTSGVLQAVFSPENWEFVAAYAVIGGAFAVLVFSMSVVSIPMLLDRDSDALYAVITSLEVVWSNTGVMVCWGVVITALIMFAIALPLAIGLVVVGPLLGHASWHAYRGAVHWPCANIAKAD